MSNSFLDLNGLAHFKDKNDALYATKDTDAVEGNIAKFDSNGNPVDGGIPANNVAQKDGYYEKMGVGMAKYIEGETPVTGSFMERTTGGDAEVANGIAQIQEVKGKSQVWNQLVPDNAIEQSFTKGAGTGFVTSTGFPTIIGHTYLVFARGLGILWRVRGANTTTSRTSKYGIIFTAAYAETCGVQVNSDTGEVGTTYSFKFNALDLTILGIDNLTTVEEVEAWLKENIGLRPYYPFNAGTVLNNKMEGLESTNRNLLDPATGKARIIGAYSDVYGNYYGITGTHGALTFTSDLGETSEITPDSDGKFLLEEPGWLDVATPGEDCAVFIWWDGTKTDYVEHKVSKAYVDVTTIYGKKNGTGELVHGFPDGMAGIGDIKDLLRNEDGVAVARKRIGVVDMGTLNWSYQSTEAYFEAKIIDAKDNNYCEYICSKYVFGGRKSSSAMENVAIGCYYFNSGGNVYVRVKDTAYSDAGTFKTAMNGVPLYYELATEEVYTDLVYMGSEHFADGTPVKLPVSLEIDNWGIERAIPQNDESLVTSAPEASILYAVDVAEEINTIHDSGIFAEDLKANLNAVLAVVNEKLGTAMGGTISLGANPVDKVYPVIFTPTPEPEPSNEGE